jgi:amidohydrolase
MEIQHQKARVSTLLDEMRVRLITIASTVHANPEIGFQEHNTSKMFVNELENHGFSVTREVAGLDTAFKAVFRGKENGVSVAFLAEMDALPSLGHACGHNIIGTAAIGAGIAISKILTELPGTITVFGTPAEEAAVDNAGGKVIMLDDIRNADVALMVHPSTRTAVRVRNVCREAFKIEFNGKPAHAGAAPELGVNALDAVINTYNLVNALRQHVQSDVRIHGIITDGGISPNIVPEYAAIKMYVRAISKTYLNEVVEKVKACARGAAEGTGTQVEIHNYAAQYLNMVDNVPLAELFQRNWESLGLTVQESMVRNYGSTDMGNVSQCIPSLHPYIKIAPDTIPGHSHAFREAANSEAAYEGLIYAAKGLAMTAIDLYMQPEQVKRMKQNFEEFKNGIFTDY